MRGNKSYVVTSPKSAVELTCVGAIGTSGFGERVRRRFCHNATTQREGERRGKREGKWGRGRGGGWGGGVERVGVVAGWGDGGV